MLDVDDREPLVRQDSVLVGVDAAPVGPAVAQQASHRHGALTEFAGITPHIENRSNSAHDIPPNPPAATISASVLYGPGRGIVDSGNWAFSTRRIGGSALFCLLLRFDVLIRSRDGLLSGIGV